MTTEERMIDIEKRKLRALEGIQDELKALRKSLDILEKHFDPKESLTIEDYAPSIKDYANDENVLVLNLGGES